MAFGMYYNKYDVFHSWEKTGRHWVDFERHVLYCICTNITLGDTHQIRDVKIFFKELLPLPLHGCNHAILIDM